MYNAFRVYKKLRGQFYRECNVVSKAKFANYTACAKFITVEEFLVS